MSVRRGIVAACLVIACGPSPPARWTTGGGANLTPAQASWERELAPVVLKRNGDVIEDGELRYRVDRAGRISMPEGKPVALILGDGHMLGPGDRDLGWLTANAGTPPDRDRPWFTLRGDGVVELHGRHGESGLDGRWDGCDAVELPTCAAVTHLLLLRDLDILEPSGSVNLQALELIRLLEILR